MAKKEVEFWRTFSNECIGVLGIGSAIASLYTNHPSTYCVIALVIMLGLLCTYGKSTYIKIKFRKNNNKNQGRRLDNEPDVSLKEVICHFKLYLVGVIALILVTAIDVFCHQGIEAVARFLATV